MTADTGPTIAALIVRGDVTLGVDLSAASFEQVNHDTHRAVLRLPEPKVHSARLDHERTKLVEVRESGLWAITPGGGDADRAMVNRAMQDAQRIVAGAGKNQELIHPVQRVIC